MRYVNLGSFRNLSKLEEDLNALGKGNDFSSIQDEAIEQVSMHESALDGLVNVRKHYENDSIECIFHVIKDEEMEMREGWVSVDLSYYMTNHYS